MSQNEVGEELRAGGARLPDATRLGRVRLQVSDLERSVGYYEHVLGLRTHGREAGHALLGGPDGLVLVELVEHSGAKPVPRRGRIGLYHFAVLLPDRAALGRFVRHLSELGIPAGASDHLVSEAIYLQDPDGLGIEVYADRPRSAWRYDAAGQLVMSTEPLNLGALVREAGDVEWSGVPAGTAIGHVHLHVRDLARAADFYHAALGLDRTVWNYPGALFLSAGGYHHHLGLNTWAGADAPVAGEDDARLIDWEIVLPSEADVETAAAALAAAGHAAPRDRDALVAADPWGTKVRIVAG